jgi:hypothetical protein
VSATEVEQVYLAYLDTLYVCDYFRAVRSGISWWSRHLDFLIALGGTGGGTTGFIGTVAKMPELAWICGPLTIFGGALAVAKSVYGWGKDITSANKVIEDYGRLSMQYRYFIDDINAQKKWDATFRKRAEDLRQTRIRITPLDYPMLDLAKRKEIQASIRQSEDRSKWWKPGAIQDANPKAPLPANPSA